MNFDEIDAYLARLTTELRKRGIVDRRIVEEARGHLVDAAEQRMDNGVDADAAEREAVARFGSAASVAATFASERYRSRNRFLVALAVAVGLAAGYINSRGDWNIARATVLFIVAAAGALGMALRRARAMLTAPDDGHSAQFHDKPPQFHFLVKSKRGWINPELAAIVADPGTQLVPFIERVVPPPLGPLGKLQSVTVLEDGGGSGRTRKYQAVFGDETRIICTVAIDRGGTGVSIDWLRAKVDH